MKKLISPKDGERKQQKKKVNATTLVIKVI